MDDNNEEMEIETFLKISKLDQLIPKFQAEEIDLQDMLVLSDIELEAVVDSSSDFDDLKIAISNFLKRNLKKGADGKNYLNGDSGNSDIEAIEDFLLINGLKDYIQCFKDEEIELENMLDLSDLDLRSLIPKVGHWNKLCRSRADFLARKDKKDPVFRHIPEQSVEEFLTAAGLDYSVYIGSFKEEGIGMAELLDLPDEILKKVVPKIGPWNKLCKAKRTLLETNSNEITEVKSDKIMEFLHALGLQQYVSVFKDEEMDFDDLMKISSANLRKVIPKMGPANKILEARKDCQAQDTSKRAKDGNCCSSDEEDEVEATIEPQVDEKKTLNILLLGETGVGKSTFINAFANYLTFETMEEAKTGKILALIASSFSVTDENFVHHKVSIGEDINENNTAGQSATQACKSYLFPFDNLAIRLIDTPGIGDTRGIDQDKVNLENILAFIAKHDDLHAICILMKPNNARLTVSFSFCIKELLCHLQKDAARNIMFVFTNSRATFYKPGDTAPTLKAILDEIEKSPPHVRIPFVKDTVYCYDNESFRYLMTYNNGIQFQGNQNSIFSDSWIISVKECKRMIEHIATLIPHKVQNTVSINDARRLIIELSKPIADIAQNINVNLQVIQDKKHELELYEEDELELESKLKVPVIDLEQVPFAQPRTVCTSPECIEVRTVGSITKTNYKTRCHDPCHLTGVQAELINNPALLSCAAMGGHQNCSHCGCSYKMHMHIYYECREVETHIEDASITELIKKKADGKVLIAQSIKTLEERSQDLETEKNLLTKATAKFAVFLKSNAIAPYNDSFQDYLEHLISNERTKNLTAGASNLLVIEGLEKMLAAYQEEKLILDQVLVNLKDGEEDASVLSSDNIKALERQLYAMKINGQKLKQFREGCQKSRQREHATYSETVHKPPKRGRKKGKTHWMNSIAGGITGAAKKWFHLN